MDIATDSGNRKEYLFVVIFNESYERFDNEAAARDWLARHAPDDWMLHRCAVDQEFPGTWEFLDASDACEDEGLGTE